VNSLDIIVLFLVFALGLKGFLHGFIKEVAGFAAIIGGIFLASRFSSDFGEFFAHMFNLKNETTSTVVAFIALFVTIWLGITFVASLVSKAVDLSGLGIADKVLGFVAAGGKIFLILSVIVFALSNISLLQSKIEGYAKDSFMYAPMKATGGFLIKLKPQDFNSSAIGDKIKEEVAKEASKEINKSLGVGVK
jgi:membrane protein required for colicin V production